MTAAFYNTTGLKGEELKQKRIKAGSLAEEIYSMFKYRPTAQLTAWDVFDKIGNNRPVTSVRRAISNLVDMGCLKYTGQTKVSGPYNERCRLIVFNNV